MYFGTDLANTKAPVQDAFNVIVGPIGMYIVLVGTLILMGGINFAELTMLLVWLHPWLKMACYQCTSKRNRYNAPYVAAIVTVLPVYYLHGLVPLLH